MLPVPCSSWRRRRGIARDCIAETGSGGDALLTLASDGRSRRRLRTSRSLGVLWCSSGEVSKDNQHHSDERGNQADGPQPALRFERFQHHHESDPYGADDEPTLQALHPSFRLLGRACPTPPLL